MKCYFLIITLLFPVKLVIECNVAFAEDDNLTREVMFHIKHTYHEPVSEQKLITAALDGMMSELDKYSVYLTPREFLDQSVNKLRGLKDLIGMDISDCHDFCKVSYMAKQSPAASAGIQLGDKIRKINQISLADISKAEIQKIAKEVAGKYLDIEYEDSQDGKIKEVKIEHKNTQDSVTSRLFDKKTLYIKITKFTEDTGRTVKKSILFAPDSVSTIILDLRNNPGGLISQAVQICDYFLNEGEILSIREKNSVIKKSYSSENGSIFDGKLFILIDKKTASAGEIVAAALQENNRATLIGEKSFGKGSLQTVIPLSNGGAIKITHALCYTPSGAPIENNGIMPDIEVDNSKKEDAQLKKAIALSNMYDEGIE